MVGVIGRTKEIYNTREDAENLNEALNINDAYDRKQSKEMRTKEKRTMEIRPRDKKNSHQPLGI